MIVAVAVASVVVVVVVVVADSSFCVGVILSFETVLAVASFFGIRRPGVDRLEVVVVEFVETFDELSVGDVTVASIFGVLVAVSLSVMEETEVTFASPPVESIVVVGCTVATVPALESFSVVFSSFVVAGASVFGTFVVAGASVFGSFVVTGASVFSTFVVAGTSVSVFVVCGFFVGILVIASVPIDSVEVSGVAVFGSLVDAVTGSSVDAVISSLVDAVTGSSVDAVINSSVDAVISSVVSVDGSSVVELWLATSEE